jgi:hypothetical protein
MSSIEVMSIHPIPDPVAGGVGGGSPLPPSR